MYHKFDVTENLFLYSAFFNGTKHSSLGKKDQIPQYQPRLSVYLPEEMDLTERTSLSVATPHLTLLLGGLKL
jgi:hypothetical protein